MTTKTTAQQIKAFDKANVQQIQTEIGEAIKAICESHGLRLAACRASYDLGETKFSLTVRVGDADALAFSAHAQMFGFEASDLGGEFIRGGKTYRIVGLRTSGLNSQKAPIICERLAGGQSEGRFMLSVDEALIGLGREPIFGGAY